MLFWGALFPQVHETLGHLSFPNLLVHPSFHSHSPIHSHPFTHSLIQLYLICRDLERAACTSCTMGCPILHDYHLLNYHSAPKASPDLSTAPGMEEMLIMLPSHTE